jgi:hypothetical protein
MRFIEGEGFNSKAVSKRDSIALTEAENFICKSIKIVSYLMSMSWRVVEKSERCNVIH